MAANRSPDISVVLPVYNAKPYLTQCLDSILLQQGVDFELIMVDDGSTDGSGEICEQYRKRDARIRVLHIPKAGAYPARNKALDMAQGRFLTFVDADDFLEPDALSILLRTQKETDADFTRARLTMFYEADVPKSYLGGADFFGEPKKSILYIDNAETKPKVCFHGGMPTSLIRLKLLRENRLRFRDDLLSGGDSWFCLQLANIRHKYHYLDHVIYNYRRQTANSLTSTYSPTKALRLLNALECYDAMLDILENDHEREVVDRAMGNQYMNYIIRYLVVCGADSLMSNAPMAFSNFKKMFCSPMAKRFLPHYDAGNHPGKSRWLPRLMRLGQVRLAFWLCRYKARKRYRDELNAAENSLPKS